MHARVLPLAVRPGEGAKVATRVVGSVGERPTATGGGEVVEFAHVHQTGHGRIVITQYAARSQLDHAGHNLVRVRAIAHRRDPGLAARVLEGH